MNAHVKPPAEKLDTFAEAFLKLQAAIKPAIKDATNPAFRSKYADLGAVWEAIKEPLQAAGFSIIQSPDFDAGDMWLKTTILHTSGDKMEGRYPIRPSKQDPQGYGSALTYARRYSISAMLGVIADDDDDGNAASTPNKPAARQAAPAPAPQQDDDVTDGVANWIASQKKALNTCATLPTVYAWMEKIAGSGTITDPDSGSALDRLKRKSPEAYGEMTQAFGQRLKEINGRNNK